MFNIDLKYPELNFLLKEIGAEIKEKENVQYRLPYLYRLLEDYLLLTEPEKKKAKIDSVMARKMGIAVMLYAAGYGSQAAMELFSKYKITGWEERDYKDIYFALEYYGELKKSYLTRSIGVMQSRNVLASFLGLIIHMDELGTWDYSLYQIIENAILAEWPKDFFGKIPADTLLEYLKMKSLPDRIEDPLADDNSILSQVVLVLMRSRYWVAPVRNYINEKTEKELFLRRMHLRAEVERVIKRKKENEEILRDES